MLQVNTSPKSAMPRKIKPMLATLTDKPFDDPNWLFETKWDGFRMISSIRNGTAELTSRNLNSFNNKFPQIRDALSKLKFSIVLDGEVVALDSKGVSHFQLLQNYWRTGKGKIAYYIFDILWYGGHNFENTPLLQRKEFLKKLLPKSNLFPYSDHILGKGKKLFDAASKLGLEGLIAKKTDSKYYEGIRTTNWLKIKTGLRQEAIICGFTEPQGSRSYFGSLLLGVYKGSDLIYIGHTGTGFNEKTLKELYFLFKKYYQDNSPFKNPPKEKDVQWLKPKLVCEVKFSNWTDEGIMRHPVYMGLRKDKDAKEVVREM